MKNENRNKEDISTLMKRTLKVCKNIFFLSKQKKNQIPQNPTNPTDNKK